MIGIVHTVSLKIFIYTVFLASGVMPLSKRCREHGNGQILDCSHAYLRQIPSNLNNAYYSMDFSNNDIAQVSEDVFRKFYQLVDLNLSYNAIVIVASSAFQNLNKLRNLDLSHNLINYDQLFPNVFEGCTSLHVLNISFQTVPTNPVYYPSQILQMTKNLQTLSIDLIPDAKFGIEIKNLTKLQTLLLTNGSIHGATSLRREMFKSLESIHLKTLVLDNCFLQTVYVDADVFVGLKYLEVVSMNYNRHLGLPTTLSLFKNVTAPIQKLYLSEMNHSKHPVVLNSTLLQNLQHFSLDVLAMCNNYIIYVDVSFHKYFPNLKELYLGRNAFIQLEAMEYSIKTLMKSYIDFLNLKMLKVLDVNGIGSRKDKYPTIYSRSILQSHNNELYNITPLDPISSTYKFHESSSFALPVNLEYLYITGTFSPGGHATRNTILLPNKLKVFDMSDNRFVDFPFRGSIRGLNELRDLIVKNNDFSFVPADAYKCCPKLRKLTLAGNRLSNMLSKDNSGKDFINLDVLEFLDLSKNDIFVLFKDTFKYLRNVRQLILYDNRLTSIDIRHLPKLQLLDLSFNFFPDVIIDISSLPAIETVNMSSNRIEYISKEAIANIDSKNISIDFTKNPFNCTNCLSLSMLQWIFNAKRFVNLIHKSQLTCSTNQSLLSADINKLENLCEHTIWIWVSVATVLVIAILIVIIGIVQRHKWTLKYWLIHAARRNYKKLPDAEYDYDAFICHSSKDVDWMKVFQKKLENGEEPHFKLCIHYRDFIPGQPIFDCINEAIVNSKYIILLISSNFIESQWCIYEMYMAKTRVFCEENRSRLVLILLENIPKNILQTAPRTLLNLLKDNVYLEWTDDPIGQEAFWDRLRERLQTDPPLQIP